MTHTHSQKEVINDTTFVLYLTHTLPMGEPAYCYLAVSGSRLLSLQLAMQHGHFNAFDYGQILASGLGDPPESVQKKMRDDYGCVTPLQSAPLI